MFPKSVLKRFLFNLQVPQAETDKPENPIEAEKVVEQNIAVEQDKSVEEESKMDEGLEKEEETKKAIEEKNADKVKVPFKKLSVKKDRNEKLESEAVERRPFAIAKSKHRKALESLRKRRKWIPSNILNDKKLAEIRRKLFATSALFGSKIACKFCSKKFLKSIFKNKILP